MEIYSAINQMVSPSYGDRLTRTVLKQLGETEIAGAFQVLQVQGGRGTDRQAA